MEPVLDISHAPGCFGSATTFSEDAPECRGCIFASQCAPRSRERLRELRMRIGLPPEPEQKRTSTRKTGADMVKEPPKKVAALMERFEQAGIKITEALAEGRNPFESRPAFMRLTCHLLLGMPDGFSRVNLMEAFKRKLNWSDGTAAAHVGQAFTILRSLDVIEENNGNFKLKR